MSGPPRRPPRSAVRNTAERVAPRTAVALAAVLVMSAWPAAAGAGVASGKPAVRPPAGITAADTPRAGPRATPAPAAPTLVSLETPGSNVRASVDSSGAQITGPSFDSPALSADGRYVAYHFHSVSTSAAGALTSTDGIIRTDRRTSTTVVIWPLQTFALDSVALASSAGGYEPSISADGSLVAFVIRPSQGASRIAVWNAGTGQVTSPLAASRTWSLVSTDEPHLDAGGDVLAFRVGAINRIQGLGIYTVDMSSGQIAPVAVSSIGANDYWGQLAISGNGQVVAFSSGRSMFGVANSDQIPQVWRVDRTTGAGTLISAGTGGGIGSLPSDRPAINGDGSVIAFESSANNLLPGDQGTFERVYAWSSGSGLRRVSSSTTGADPSGNSTQAALSTDGRYASFASDAEDIVPGDSTGRPLAGQLPGRVRTAAFVQTYPADIFMVDLVNGRTSRVSVGVGTTEPDGGSGQPSLSSTGRFVAFASAATNLVPGDTNGKTDIFVRDRTPALSVAPNPLDFGSVAPGPPGASQLLTVTSTGSSGATVTQVKLAGANAGDWFPVADGCTGVTLYPGDACTVQLLFVPTKTGSRSATLQVTHTAPGSPIVVRLTGKSGAGSITINPTVGAPGIVTVVTGTGFPPNAAVALRWSAGITPAQLSPVVTDATGAFVAQMLILPRDVTGLRRLQVSVSLPGLTLPPATAPFLVVDGTAVPPVSGLIQVFRDALGRPIILRR